MQANSIHIAASADPAALSNTLVIVIDVLRAFSVTSYLYHQTQQPIRLVKTVEQALQLKAEYPQAQLIGEVDGLPIAGFDYGNSPAQMLAADNVFAALPGPFVLRTTHGVASVLQVQAAPLVFAGSFVNALATITHIQRQYLAKPGAEYTCPFSEILLLISDRQQSEEDWACADYMRGLLLGQAVDLTQIRQRILQSKNAKKFLQGDPRFPEQDLTLSVQELPQAVALKVHIKQEAEAQKWVYLDRDMGYA